MMMKPNLIFFYLQTIESSVSSIYAAADPLWFYNSGKEMTQ